MFVIKAKVSKDSPAKLNNMIGLKRSYDYYYVPGAAFDTYSGALSVFLRDNRKHFLLNSKLLLSIVSGFTKDDIPSDAKSNDYVLYNPVRRPDVEGYECDRYTIRDSALDSFFIEDIKDNEYLSDRIIRSGRLVELMETGVVNFYEDCVITELRETSK